MIEGVLHEIGHGFDYFLGPGWPRDGAPVDCPACADGCDEDTTDEAWPLTETIAQMFAMWQLVRLFPNMPHDSCDLMSRLVAGSNNNTPIVHSPGCMDETDEIGLFIRDDDLACTDVSVCDKPSDSGGDGGVKRCNHNDGYNAFSVLQVWWNALHGLYCEPTYPFACTSVAVTWPPGCDQMGSPVECVTPDEAAGLALLYSLRTNPLTYADFFDSMARFVSCNYGPVAYDDFNQALCEHDIRSCTEPPPSDCEVCGNGIREGGEQCDGNDLSVDELGYVPGCTDLDDYIGGVLGCTQQCTYDTSQCVSPPDTTGGSENSSGEGEEEAGEEDDSGTGPGTGGADGGGGGGCGCIAGDSTNRATPWALALLLLIAIRRRRATGLARPEVVAALLVVVATTACGDDHASSNEATGTSSSTSSMETSDTVSPVAGWPDDWLGDYHVDDPAFPVGMPAHANIFLPENVTIERERARVQFYGCSGTESVERSYRVAFAPGSVELLPEHEGEELVWVEGVSGLERITMRPGETCDQLELVHEYADSTESEVTSVLVRGRLCVIDPCDLADPNEDPTLILDYCPGTVHECEMPATASD